MRAIGVFLAGLVLGAALLFVVIQIAGGWYTYSTMPKDLCEAMPPQAEVVPHQPNPCNFRRPRWRILY
jgi:hypothetical protein